MHTPSFIFKTLLVAGLLLVGPPLVNAAGTEAVIPWLPWGDSAWAQAKQESKPLFVHVKSAGSERSADMQRIAFAQELVVESLRQKFVCVQVDADEYPGVQSVLGAFVMDTQQETGLPLNVWLSDTGAPFLGRTYLEPNDEWGKLGLINLIERVSSRQATDPKALRAEAAMLLENHFGQLPAAAADRVAATKEAVALLAAGVSQSSGVNPVIVRVTPRAWLFLVQQAAAGHREADVVREMLVRLACGPLRDAVSGAFFSRSATPEGDWPILEIDTAVQIGLAEAYLAAARIWPKDGFAEVANELLAWLADAAASPGGLPIRWTASLAGPTVPPFLWSADEVRQVRPEHAKAVTDWLGLSEKGKVPEIMDPDRLWAERYLLQPSLVETLTVWPAVRAALRENQREKLKAGGYRTASLETQALAAVVLAEGSRQLQQPAYFAAARRLTQPWAQLLTGDISSRLRRFPPNVPATARDLIAVMLALVEVEQSAKDGVAPAVGLARLQQKITNHFMVDGLYGFPAGTALPYREVPDLREDGILLTANALAVRLSHATGGQFGLRPEAVWMRAGRTVFGAPDTFPELLRQLAR